MATMRFPKCVQDGKCFGKTEDGKCAILSCRVIGKCRFQKPERNVTDGKVYMFIERKE